MKCFIAPMSKIMDSKKDLVSDFLSDLFNIVEQRLQFDVLIWDHLTMPDCYIFLQSLISI